jgi:aminopeptidase N
MVLLNANSYQKGGWVLHMLRRKLGETTYWKGIRNYYAKYDGGNANTDDLRTVMEQASGQDLKQFFKQWLYTTGTPHLKYAWVYDGDKKVIDITIVQQQESHFEFPLQFMVDNKIQTFAIKNKLTHLKFSVITNPVKVIIDPNVNLLAQFEKVNYAELMLQNKAE